MKKGMNKVVMIMIVVLVLVFVVSLVVYAKSRPQELAIDQEQLYIHERPLKKDVEEPKVSVENQDYIENQVVAVADSKREAKKIAKAIGGELLSYDNQVAVIQIGITVEEMMQRLEEDSSLPKVYPNYQNYSN